MSGAILLIFSLNLFWYKAVLIVNVIKMQKDYSLRKLLAQILLLSPMPNLCLNVQCSNNNLAHAFISLFFR